MIEIINNLLIGDDSDCSKSKFLEVEGGVALIHACKTCHKRALGYSGNLRHDHPNYLIYPSDKHLYLNIVDMPRELLPIYMHPISRAAMSFIKDNITTGPILMHCNKGFSRSPSLGLIYLAQTGAITNESYDSAADEFIGIYPFFMPGAGIELYMKNNWAEILNL